MEINLRCFVDSKKASDRVPREVIKWAMHKLGDEEWSVLAVEYMYTTITTVLWLPGLCQKGKTSLGLLEKEIVSGSGISWAIYANLHLIPDR